MEPSNEPKLQFPSEPNISVRSKWARVHAAQRAIKVWNGIVQEINQPEGRDREGGALDGIFIPDPEALHPLKPLSPESPDKLPPLPEGLRLGVSPPKESDGSEKVAIIGSGAAGLFTGMIFDYLNQWATDFHVDYDILEASPRIGGRLFTHFFDANQQLLYYDVGAMRFPENPVMKR
jgi:flavin-dependent amine oxidoreductase